MNARVYKIILVMQEDEGVFPCLRIHGVVYISIN